MEPIFDIMREGILIIDKDARIVYANRAYYVFLNMDASRLVGKILRDVRPGARLPNVFMTGKPILNVPRQEHEDVYFVNMYPIFQGKEVVGGISVVTFIDQAYAVRSLLKEVERSRQVLKRISKVSIAKYTFDDVVAIAPQSLKVKELALRAAATEATVLLQSESGTGKELYAQAIHNASARNGSIFLAVNCANFNSNILESELFGYSDGAFTGAKKGGKIGLFEAASGGTIFLDEISEMDYALQSKLLRVLEERSIRPLGNVEERAVDVRIIAACNADLRVCMQEGRFREDLYYRLSAFPIHIHPLRERREDIELLTRCFLDEFSRKQRRGLTINEKALRQLCVYDWPGNVRELRNVLEFVSYLSDDGAISVDLLPESVIKPSPETQETLVQRVKRLEQSEINKLLRQYGKDLKGKNRVAAELGISLASLYNKLKHE